MAWNTRRAPEDKSPDRSDDKPASKSLIRKVGGVLLLFLVFYVGMTLFLFSRPENLNKQPWKWDWPEDWKGWSKFATELPVDSFRRAKARL